MRIYLAGPMTGIKDFNFPLFDHVAAQLRREGHEVCNPADVQRELYGEVAVANAWTEEEAALAIRHLLAYELAWICRHAECIMLLPGWEGFAWCHSGMCAGQGVADRGHRGAGGDAAGY